MNGSMAVLARRRVMCIVVVAELRLNRSRNAELVTSRIGSVLPQDLDPPTSTCSYFDKVSSSNPLSSPAIPRTVDDEMFRLIPA